MPFFKLYKTFSNTKTWVINKTDVTVVQFKSIFTNFISTMSFLINPQLTSEQHLKQIQLKVLAKEKRIEYFTAAALRKLATEHNIYLTSTNNESFKMFPNKSVIVDVNMTEYIRNKVVDQIADRLSKKNKCTNTIYQFSSWCCCL